MSSPCRSCRKRGSQHPQQRRQEPTQPTGHLPVHCACQACSSGEGAPKLVGRVGGSLQCTDLGRALLAWIPADANTANAQGGTHTREVDDICMTAPQCGGLGVGDAAAAAQQERHWFVAQEGQWRRQAGRRWGALAGEFDSVRDHFFLLIRLLYRSAESAARRGRPSAVNGSFGSLIEKLAISGDDTNSSWSLASSRAVGQPHEACMWCPRAGYCPSRPQKRRDRRNQGVLKHQTWRCLCTEAHPPCRAGNSSRAAGSSNRALGSALRATGSRRRLSRAAGGPCGVGVGLVGACRALGRAHRALQTPMKVITELQQPVDAPRVPNQDAHLLHHPRCCHACFDVVSGAVRIWRPAGERVGAGRGRLRLRWAAATTGSAPAAG